MLVATLIQPDRYKHSRILSIEDGVSAHYVSGPTHEFIQALTFDNKKFTIEQSKEWLRSHNKKCISLDTIEEDNLNVQKGPPPMICSAIQAFVSVSTSIQALYGLDIISLVPSDIIEKLKSTDPHPFLQAYSICHEGVSTPTLLGDTARPVHWTRKAVQSIKAVVLKGVQFFFGHEPGTNSTQGRDVLGEVIWNGEKVIDGILHHIVVGYFPHRERVQAMDICSQESNWDFFEEAGKWFADKVDKITGIALSNSKNSQPAFAGARRLAMIQALEQDEEKPVIHHNRRKEDKRMEKPEISTFALSDIIAELKTRQTVPHQLFSLAELQADPTFAPVFSEVTSLKAKIVEHESSIKKLSEEKAIADSTVRASTAKERYAGIIGGMTLTPKQKVYLTRAYPEKLNDASDDALKTFIAARLEDYKIAVQTFDIKEELPKQRSEEQNAKTEEEEDDMSRAANNPLLEADLDL